MASFVNTLSDRFVELRACGLPDTLVHGDFHPGNVRGHDYGFTIMDWADCGIGHPLLDVPAFLRTLTAADQENMRAYWYNAWSCIPGSQPARAGELIAPIAAARSALVYQGFLDQIEESERVYHRNDVVTWLGAAAQLVRAELR